MLAVQSEATYAAELGAVGPLGGSGDPHKETSAVTSATLGPDPEPWSSD